MVLEKLDIHKPKYRTLFNPLPCTTIISKWTRDPDAKIKMIKFLEENIGENVCDLELDKDFFKHDTKTQSVKAKIWLIALIQS